MFCCFGQFNNPFMLINPYMLMNVTGLGIYNMPKNYGVPYNSLLTGMPSINPFGGFTGLGTSIFTGGTLTGPYTLGSIFPTFQMTNTLQQTPTTTTENSNTSSSANYGSLFGFLNSRTSTATTTHTETTSKITSENETNTDTASTSATSIPSNGKSRPAAGKKLGKDFLNEVKRVAQKIRCDYRDLLAIMNSESGLNPQAVNPKGGATGLIQFMPGTARSLGTTTEALKKMTAIEQMTYVEKFYVLQKKTAGFSDNHSLTAGDLYALTFLPARAKREVLCEKNERDNYYKWNKGMDLNKDGKITKSELAQRVEKRRVDESIFA